MKPSQAVVARCKVRGVSKWRVRWRELGRVKRKFFNDRDEADVHAASVSDKKLTDRQKLFIMPPDEREQMLKAWNTAKEKGIDIMEAIAKATATGPAPTLAKVLAELTEAKRKAGKSSRYIDQLDIAVGMFVKGRGAGSIGSVTLHDLESFLDSKTIRSRPTLRARLSTFFNFAIRRGYRVDNPCNRLETVTLEHVTPEVMTVAEVEKALEWLKKHPRSMAWFVLSTFAGLRPEEAEKTQWKFINFKEGWIRVEAQTSKVRMRRVVYPKPMAMEWLALAKKLKAKLPIVSRTRRDDHTELASLLGWKEWKQDVTRHTCASNWIADCSSLATVATALGNSESTLRKHYMALVTKADAAKFWAVKPTTS